MIVLDTDTLTHYFLNHPGVLRRHRDATDEVVITVVSRIETLQGRFATLLNAADGTELLRGQQRLDQADYDLRPFRVLLVTNAVAAEFDQLLKNKKIRSIGRGDLIIPISRK
jgi:predicted nucleic acid-binding protein